MAQQKGMIVDGWTYWKIAKVLQHFLVFFHLLIVEILVIVFRVGRFGGVGHDNKR